MAAPFRSGLLRHTATRLRPARPSPAARPLARAAPRRAASTLAVLEHRDGKLHPASLACISAARQLGGSVHGFVAGSRVHGVAAEASRVAGLDKVVYVDNAAYDPGLAENWAPLLADNVARGRYTHVVAGHTAFGKNVVPRLAALLDVQPLADVTAVQAEDTFVRPIYAGNAICTLRTQDRPTIVTVRGTAFPPAPADGGGARVEEGTDPKAECPTEWVGEDLARSDRPDLATAERVVSGGRGLKSKEEFDKLMPPLADALGAAIGASRAAVDSGFADNSLQVGQTGKNVAPQLYLCAGISGAIQHLAGMKDSKVIAAINKDPDAPIFQVADVGLVGDLFDTLPELTEKLKN